MDERTRLGYWRAVLGAEVPVPLRGRPAGRTAPARAEGRAETRRAAPAAQPRKRERAAEPAACAVLFPPGAAAAGSPSGDKRSALAALATEAAACTACPLHGQRRQAVFADGDPDARLMFVGEGPGRDEDLQGLPFVGRAGKLLTDIIEKGMGLKRAEVYIANVVKCRPPGNRTPAPEEQAACAHFLEAQIRLVSPEMIVALGAVAARHLLQTDLPMRRLRGRVHRLGPYKLVVTWHPAYLLRRPDCKRETWEDVQLVLRELGLPIPGTRRSGRGPARPSSGR